MSFIVTGRDAAPGHGGLVAPALLALGAGPAGDGELSLRVALSARRCVPDGSP